MRGLYLFYKYRKERCKKCGKIVKMNTRDIIYFIGERYLVMDLDNSESYKSYQRDIRIY